MSTNSRLAALVALLLPLSAHAADAVIHLDSPGQTLYVRVLTSSTASVAAALTEGTSSAVGRYVVADSALVTAGLSTAGTYPFKVFSGSPSTSANDQQVGQGSLNWSGSAALPEKTLVQGFLGTLLTEVTAGRVANNFKTFFANGDASSLVEVGDIASVTSEPIAPTKIGKSRTWRFSPFDGSKAENIVTVKAEFQGTLAVEFDLNAEADIDTFGSVVITDPSGDAVTATNLAIRADGLAAHFDVPELTEVGTYTVVPTITTLDGQTIPMDCTLVVR